MNSVVPIAKKRPPVALSRSCAKWKKRSNGRQLSTGRAHCRVSRDSVAYAQGDTALELRLPVVDPQYRRRPDGM
jgi:hypothetical protein